MYIDFLNDKSKDLLSCNFIIPVGEYTIIDGYGGFAHLIEHLIFHGHESMSQYELLNEIEGMGAIINGQTYELYTIIFARVEKKYLNSLIDLVCNAIVHFNVTLENYIIEKEIIKNEERSLYRGGESIIKKRVKDIKKTVKPRSLSKIKEIYSKAYGMDKWILLIAGNLSVEDKRQFKKRWDCLNLLPVNLLKNDEIEYSSLQKERITYWKTRKQNSFWFCCLIQCKRVNSIFFKLIKYIFVSGLSSYFYDIIVAKNGYSYNLEFYDDPINHNYLAITFEYHNVSFEKIKSIFDEVFNNPNFIVELDEEVIKRAVNLTCTEYELKSESFSSIINDKIKAIIYNEDFYGFSDIIKKIRDMSVEEIKAFITEMIYNVELVD